MAWAADVVVVEARGAEVHPEDEDLVTVEDVGEEVELDVVVEAFLVEDRLGVVEEAASAGEAHRLVWFMVVLAFGYNTRRFGRLNRQKLGSWLTAEPAVCHQE